MKIKLCSFGILSVLKFNIYQNHQIIELSSEITLNKSKYIGVNKIQSKNNNSFSKLKIEKSFTGVVKRKKNKEIIIKQFYHKKAINLVSN